MELNFKKFEEIVLQKHKEQNAFYVRPDLLHGLTVDQALDKLNQLKQDNVVNQERIEAEQDAIRLAGAVMLGHYGKYKDDINSNFLNIKPIDAEKVNKQLEIFPESVSITENPRTLKDLDYSVAEIPVLATAPAVESLEFPIPLVKVEVKGVNCITYPISSIFNRPVTPSVTTPDKGLDEIAPIEELPEVKAAVKFPNNKRSIQAYHKVICQFLSGLMTDKKFFSLVELETPVTQTIFAWDKGPKDATYNSVSNAVSSYALDLYCTLTDEGLDTDLNFFVTKFNQWLTFYRRKENGPLVHPTLKAGSEDTVCTRFPIRYIVLTEAGLNEISKVMEEKEASDANSI